MSDDLKSEMEAMKQQMFKAKKNERASLLGDVTCICKEFGFTFGMLKASLAKMRGHK